MGPFEGAPLRLLKSEKERSAGGGEILMGFSCDPQRQYTFFAPSSSLGVTFSAEIGWGVTCVGLEMSSFKYENVFANFGR